MDLHGGRCLDCDMIFGCNLNIRPDPRGTDALVGGHDTVTPTRALECPVCHNSENRKATQVQQTTVWLPFVKFPHCDHETCIACFRLIHGLDPEPDIYLSDHGGKYYFDNENLHFQIALVRKEGIEFDEKEYRSFLAYLLPEDRQVLRRLESEMMPQLKQYFPNKARAQLRQMYFYWVMDPQRRWWNEHLAVVGQCPICMKVTTRTKNKGSFCL